MTSAQRLARLRVALIEAHTTQLALERAEEREAAELQAWIVFAVAAKLHRLTTERRDVL